MMIPLFNNTRASIIPSFSIPVPLTLHYCRPLPKRILAPSFPLSSPFSSSASPSSLPYHPRRSLLYVPLSSPKLLTKCVTTPLSADTISLDLEDSVTPTMKASARLAMIDTLTKYSSNATGTIGPSPSTEAAVRINPYGSPYFHDDLLALQQCSVLPNAVLLPKINTKDEVMMLSAFLHELVEKHRVRFPSSTGPYRKTPIDIIGMIETGKGMLSLQSILDNNDNIHMDTLIFGGDDYAADMGIERSGNNKELEWIRNYFVLIGRAYGKQLIDIVNIDYKDTGKLQQEVDEGCMMGFTGKQCIHPSQIDVINRGFAPKKSKVDWAKRVLEEERKNPDKGAFAVDGQMIDLPTIKQARGILEKAKACGIQVE